MAYMQDFVNTLYNEVYTIRKIGHSEEVWKTYTKAENVQKNYRNGKIQKVVSRKRWIGKYRY